jgi:hypothetical protein
MSGEYSIRTQYRKIRIKYIRSTIAALIDLLEMPQKYLEKIPLAFFKNIKNSVESELVWEKDSEREMAGIHIYPNDAGHTANTLPKNQSFNNVKKRFDKVFGDDKNP